MKIVGLTGGIACGKSEATKFFIEEGVAVIDCDALVHEIQSKNTQLIQQLKEHFPEAFNGDILDRSILSRLALANKEKLRLVERLTLPYVRQEIKRKIAQYRSEGHQMVVIDAPLLFEKGLNQECDETICIYVDKETQKKRFLNRPNMTEEKWQLIQSKQTPLEELKKRCDYQFYSENLESLHSSIRTFLKSSLKKKENIAFYPGSFDPFTRGHFSLLCEAINRYDNIVVGIGINPEKKKHSLFSPEERETAVLKTIQDFLKDYKYRKLTGKYFSASEEEACQKLMRSPNIVRVISYQGLTVDAAILCEAKTMIRGERNMTDHLYESEIAKANQELLSLRGIEMTFATVSPANQDEISHISSSKAKTWCAIGEYALTLDYVSSSVHAMMMEKYLFDVFAKAAKDFGITDEQLIQTQYQELVDFYNDERRQYHTLSHVGTMLNYLKVYEVSQQNALSSQSSKALVMAILFHDIIQGENAEELSKQKATAFLAHGNDASAARLVERCIDVTAYIKPSETVADDLSLEEKLMIDLDLSMLAHPSQYAKYAQKVRDEYSQYGDWDFSAGRTAILEEFLQKQNIYQTPLFQNRFEEQARENLSKERTYWKDVHEKIKLGREHSFPHSR